MFSYLKLKLYKCFTYCLQYGNENKVVFFRVLSRSTEAWNIDFDNFLQWIMNNMTATHYLQALKCLFYILLLIHRIKCLFIFGVYRPTWAFRTYGDVTIAGEGLQIMTYARHSWLLRNEGSLAYHTYCDTGHPFIMIISEDPWHFTLLSVWQWSCHYLFFRLRSVVTGDRDPISRTRGECSTSTPTQWFRIICFPIV